jgi:hypothetical protein
VQVDEKWSFVGKKERNRDPDDPADDLCGDCWDHVALDPDSRLVLEILVGPRTTDMAEMLLEGVRDRLGSRAPEDAGDGGWADRPRLDACGVGHPTRHSTVEGHHRAGLKT